MNLPCAFKNVLGRSILYYSEARKYKDTKLPVILESEVIKFFYKFSRNELSQSVSLWNNYFKYFFQNHETFLQIKSFLISTNLRK